MGVGLSETRDPWKRSDRVFTEVRIIGVAKKRAEPVFEKGDSGGGDVEKNERGEEVFSLETKKN